MSRTRWAPVALFAAAVGWGCAAGGAENAAEGAADSRLVTDELAALTVHVYKSPSCGCCASWVEHLREAGFTVEVEDTDALAAVKADAGVPASLQSCHTARVGDYVFEGHVPAADMVRFLEEKPDARGLAVPGMPVGSPGMEMGDRVDPYDVLIFDETSSAVYQTHR